VSNVRQFILSLRLLCALPLLAVAIAGCGTSPARPPFVGEEMLMFQSPHGFFIATVRDGAVQVRQLPREHEPDRAWALSRSGKMIWKRKDGPFVELQLFERKLQARPLAKQKRPGLPDGNRQFALSHDGRTLAYTTEDKDRKASLVCEDLATGAVHTVVKGRICLIDPAWSPDGTRIAYYCMNDPEYSVGLSASCQAVLSLHVVDVATGKDRRVASPSKASRSMSVGEFRDPPAWSPDGTEIAYYCTRDAKLAKEINRATEGVCLNIVNIATGKDRRVAPPSQMTHQGGYDGEWRHSPVWSATGDRLFFKAQYAPDGGRSSHTYQVAASGGSRPALIGWDVCWSASPTDGTLYATSGASVYGLTLAGNKVTRRTLITENGSQPKISPSGRVVAYAKQGFTWNRPVLYVRLLEEDRQLLVHNPVKECILQDIYWTIVPPPGKEKK